MSNYAYKAKIGTKLEPVAQNLIAATDLTEHLVNTHDFFCTGIVCGEVCGAKLSACTWNGEYHHFAAMGNSSHKEGCIFDESSKSTSKRTVRCVEARGGDWTPLKMCDLLLKPERPKPPKVETSEAVKLNEKNRPKKPVPTEISMIDSAPRDAKELLITLQNLPLNVYFGNSGKTTGQLIADDRTISSCRRNGIDGEYRLVIAKKLTKMVSDSDALLIRLRDSYPYGKHEKGLFYELSCSSKDFFYDLYRYINTKGPNTRFAIFGRWTKDTRPTHEEGSDIPFYKCSFPNGHVCKVARISAIYCWEETPPSTGS